MCDTPRGMARSFAARAFNEDDPLASFGPHGPRPRQDRRRCSVRWTAPHAVRFLTFEKRGCEPLVRRGGLARGWLGLGRAMHVDLPRLARVDRRKGLKKAERHRDDRREESDAGESEGKRPGADGAWRIELP